MQAGELNAPRGNRAEKRTLKNTESFAVIRREIHWLLTLDVDVDFENQVVQLDQPTLPTLLMNVSGLDRLPNSRRIRSSLDAVVLSG